MRPADAPKIRAARDSCRGVIVVSLFDFVVVFGADDGVLVKVMIRDVVIRDIEIDALERAVAVVRRLVVAEVIVRFTKETRRYIVPNDGGSRGNRRLVDTYSLA